VGKYVGLAKVDPPKEAPASKSGSSSLLKELMYSLTSKYFKCIISKK